MNKGDLVNAMAAGSGLSKADAERALDAMIDAIKTELQKGGEVALVGFGVFVVRERAARSGRNPRTGEEINIAASKVPAFRPGKVLKDAVA